MLQKILLASLLVVGLIDQISGHAKMLEPPNRSSLWRYDSSATPNYQDDENFCGGKTYMWNEMGGKCGVCGDKYDAPHPQNNENTGKYGQGKVARTYKPGSTIDVQIEFTTSHQGYFNFSLCVLENPNAPESGESCFQPLTLGDGQAKYNLVGGEASVHMVNTQVKLPSGLTCERCTLRFNYYAGNNWGDCGDGTSAMGCGAQETFRSCADIAIL